MAETNKEIASQRLAPRLSRAAGFFDLSFFGFAGTSSAMRLEAAEVGGHAYIPNIFDNDDCMSICVIGKGAFDIDDHSTVNTRRTQRGAPQHREDYPAFIHKLPNSAQTSNVAGSRT